MLKFPLQFFYATCFAIATSFCNESIAQTFAIQPRFDFAGPFSEGLADVKISGKSAYIDKSGKVIFILQKEIDFAYPFMEGMARVLSKDNKYGFVDRSGKTLIDFKFTSAQDFKEGLSVISFEPINLSSSFLGNSRKGAINKFGKYVINPYLNVLFDANEGYLIANFGPLGDPTVGVIDKY
jgi:hypothetical protein